MSNIQRVKYPRTPHLPWSPGFTADDVVSYDLSTLFHDNVVISLKMDGEATTLYPDGYAHARSVDSPSHPSRDWVKALAASVGFSLREDMRICGENLYARHSIAYDDLESYFMIYGIWVTNTCYEWKLTETWAKMLAIPTVPVIYTGPMPSEKEITNLFKMYEDSHEGYVIRSAGAIHLDDFPKKVFKWVRPNHVQTDEHWMSKEVVKNKLRTP